MTKNTFSFSVIFVLIIGFTLAGCLPSGPCEFTGNTALTVYRLPNASSDVFGTLPAGETHEVLARTANGWIGFDPGVAQAGNTGLARHRWVLLNATLSPFCLADVDLVTLGDVEHDLFASNLNPPDIVITNVNLPSTQIEENVFAPVEVTVQNQGGGVATDYDVVLFPLYGYGPQNPGGQNPVPDLAPGASYTITFSPGVIYSTPGIYTLRVLVTDDWYSSTGSPDSIGTNGDIEDIEIHVVFNICYSFAEMEVSLVLLGLPEDTRNLPLYLKVGGGVPGLDPEAVNGAGLYEYSAKLGDIQAYQCGLQGFPDRLYCMFNMPPGTGGTALNFELRLNNCEDPVYTLPMVSIPEPLAGDDPGLVCTVDLGPGDCEAAGGHMSDGVTTAPRCVCP